jgi:hypothetical protein
MQLSVARDVEDQSIEQILDAFTHSTEVSGLPVGTRIAVDDSGRTMPEFIRLMASNEQSETLKTTSWTITLEGWAQSETRASKILSLACAALAESEGLLYGASIFGGAGNDPHPDYPNMSRYSALVGIKSRNSIENI